MRESSKKLALFSAIFLICAMVLFFVLQLNTAEPPAVSAASQEISRAQHEEIARLKNELEKAPENVELLIQLGNLYFDASRYQDAVSYYEAALARNPSNPLVLTDCAVMYFQLGDSDRALEYLQRAIVLKPDLPQAYYNKGLILMMAKGQKEQALEAWREYIRIAPDSDQAEFVRKQIEAVEASVRQESKVP